MNDTHARPTHRAAHGPTPLLAGLLLALLVSAPGCGEAPGAADSGAAIDAGDPVAPDAFTPSDTGSAADADTPVDAAATSDAGAMATGRNRLTVNGTEYVFDGPVAASFAPTGASITNFGYVARTADDAASTSFGLVLQTSTLPPAGPVACSATRPPAVGGGSNNITFGGTTYRWAPDDSECSFVVTHAAATVGARFAGTYSGTLVALDGTTLAIDGEFDTTVTGP
jgi:hypothetical protein